MKTNRSTKKRITKTGTGKFKHAKAYRRHILETKPPKRRRNLRKSSVVAKANEKKIRKLLPGV
jgi:large subunit ribosomal protein L35